MTVQGLGAKAAMAILTVLTPDELADAVIAGDRAMVARADGVGPKLVQRVVNELATKIGPCRWLRPAWPGRRLAVVVPAAMKRSASMRCGAGRLGYGRAEAHGAGVPVPAVRREMICQR